jgi:hypothetical protein
MFFAAPGTQVIEIGYSGKASMPFPSFFFHFAQVRGTKSYPFIIHHFIILVRFSLTCAVCL